MKEKNAFIEPMLAWRSLWKNRRRTILTLLTITVGCSMMILFHAWTKGGHGEMIDDAIRVNTGHIQVHEKGYWDNRTLEYSFVPTASLMESLQADKRIIGVAPRVVAGGLLSCKNATQAAFIQAVDPEKEKTVSLLHQKVLKGGRYLKPGDRKEIVIGDVLAQNLNVGVGNEITMISQGFDGSIAAANLNIVGIFKSNNPEYDQGLVIMPIEQAAETFAMMRYMSALVIKLRDSDDSFAVRDMIRKKSGKGLEVMAYDELLPELMQFVEFDDAGGYIMDLVLLTIIAFGILNTIQMSVFERIREFGVMLAIGTRPEQVKMIVMMESFFIAVLGVILGLALGTSLSIYFAVFPLDFQEMAKEWAVYGISTTLMPARLTWVNLTLTPAVILVLSVLFTISPAKHASRLRPIEAIRHL